MHPKFRALVEPLEPKFQRLISMEPVKLSSLPRKMPEAGVYVFFEDGKPLYIGRTNRMKNRIRYHSRESAKDAPFAFRIARESTGYTKASYQKKDSRKDLLSKPDFINAFADAKQRIRNMDLRFVEESNQIRQALLEVYTAVVLETPYNDFETH